ncbi:MAG: nicotinate-nucleotide--dimethylbenzimidazole phosphoribosyltransferase, partial [Methylococcaceae bacterium]|nr:nicotinate-nucleotide--dimethylbenzimidazole phosphoribosyltransferase [Methylococcaceae bacterium]
MPLDFVISPLDTTLKIALQIKIEQKTKPLGALGQLETLALHIGLCQNSLTPCLTKPSILIFAGDHGVVAAGVSAYPQTVTAQMVANFLAGGAAISVFAKQHGLKLIVVDAGVNADLDPHPQLHHAKIGMGTQNFLTQSAMSQAECLQAIRTGADLVTEQHATGCNCIGFGEMGIGNTSSAALLMHILTGLPLAQCVGRGTGLSDGQLNHKLQVLQQALEQNGGWGEERPPTKLYSDRWGSQSLPQPMALNKLATFGGFEIAMMVGAYL